MREIVEGIRFDNTFSYYSTRKNVKFLFKNLTFVTFV